jgi:hypothetical protein
MTAQHIERANRRTWLFTLIWLCVVSAAPLRATESCKPTPLSVQEARDILDQTPQFIRSRSDGRVPAPMDWIPASPYVHPKLFYYFEVRTANSQDADGGLIGYFAVHKLTGHVFDYIDGDEPIESPALAAVERKLQVKHCVSAQLVAMSNEDLP